MSKVVIVGGGAAGMLASVYAARNGHEVHVLEKNEKLGKKLYITGKGRCNLTNACGREELFSAVMRNRKFLYSAFYTYGPDEVMDFFEKAGVSLKIERGNRVFPCSDHSSDIIRALTDQMKRAGVHIHLHTEAAGIMEENGQASGVRLSDGRSTGDGYRFAEETGHKVTQRTPSLVPLHTKEDYIPKLQGLSLRNVKLTIKKEKKTLYQDFGEMLFTHQGVSGPLVLSASAVIADQLEKGELKAWVDLKPALSLEQLDARILRECFSEGLSLYHSRHGRV